MNVKRKERISAWLLLLVYVPMMLAISLHVHVDNGNHEETECAECVNHIPHDGHLDVYSDNVHDCVLCQLASLSYVAPAVVAVVMAAVGARVAFAQNGTDLCLGVCDTRSTRAPPAF